MGRYYNGDIEGKFWFGVQASDAADRFGYTGEEICDEDDEDFEPYELAYWFEKDIHLELVEEELKNIEQILGDNLYLFDNFFSIVNGYNDQTFRDHNIDPSLWDRLGSHYADYYLGLKIRDYLREHDICEFWAEL